MKKLWILLLLATVITVQFSILSSYSRISDFVSVSGTSAVVVGKTNYVSMRATFFIRTNLGESALIIFANGTEQEVSTHLVFEVFLPKTEPVHSTGILSMSRAEEGVFITDQEPMDIAIVSNADEDFFKYKVGPAPNGQVIFYWFKILGDATVSVTVRGVII
jgi:hypothetical protein